MLAVDTASRLPAPRVRQRGERGIRSSRDFSMDCIRFCSDTQVISRRRRPRDWRTRAGVGYLERLWVVRSRLGPLERHRAPVPAFLFYW